MASCYKTNFFQQKRVLIFDKNRGNKKEKNEENRLRLPMKSFSYKSLRLAFSGISYLKFDKKKNEGGERYCLFFF